MQNNGTMPLLTVTTKLVHNRCFVCSGDIQGTFTKIQSFLLSCPSRSHVAPRLIIQDGHIRTQHEPQHTSEQATVQTQSRQKHKPITVRPTADVLVAIPKHYITKSNVYALRTNALHKPPDPAL